MMNRQNKESIGVEGGVAIKIKSIEELLNEIIELSSQNVGICT